MLFREYKYSDVNNINNPDIVEEWEYNMDKEAYEDNLHMGVYLPYENIELDISMNEYHRPKLLLDEIEWFHFQVIFNTQVFM